MININSTTHTFDNVTINTPRITIRYNNKNNLWSAMDEDSDNVFKVITTDRNLVEVLNQLQYRSLITLSQYDKIVKHYELKTGGPKIF
jgi:hypothetical protein